MTNEKGQRSCLLLTYFGKVVKTNQVSGTLINGQFTWVWFKKNRMSKIERRIKDHQQQQKRLQKAINSFDAKMRQWFVMVTLCGRQQQPIAWSGTFLRKPQFLTFCWNFRHSMRLLEYYKKLQKASDHTKKV